MPLESRSCRRADCSKQGQYVPTSVETYLTSPRLDCLKREQRHGRHLFAKTNTTHSFSASANDTVDLCTLPFTYPSVFLEDLISLTWLFYISILFFNPCCNIAGAVHSKAKSLLLQICKYQRTEFPHP